MASNAVKNKQMFIGRFASLCAHWKNVKKNIGFYVFFESSKMRQTATIQHKQKPEMSYMLQPCNFHFFVDAPFENEENSFFPQLEFLSLFLRSRKWMKIDLSAY